jgi:hypothetical protein
MNLADQAQQTHTAGWATPRHGKTTDMAGWKLNPRFSLWLMGYPDEWACCGERAMQSSRKSRKRSSKQQKAQG